MYCSNCGTKLDDDALFCTKCGTKVEIVAEVVPEPVVEQKPEPEISQAAESEVVKSNATASEAKSNSAENRPSFLQNSNMPIIIGGIIILIIMIAAIIQNHKPAGWIDKDTYNFNIHTPYTFNHYDYDLMDDYEFDCYKLSDSEIERLWNNPPKYAVYGNSTYTLDNENLDFFEIDTNGLLWSEEFGSKAGNILKNYNVIILWDEFDGKYHHFDEIFVIKGTQGYGLYKYIDFSKYQW